MSEQERQQESDLAARLRAAYAAGKAATSFATQERSGARVDRPRRPPADDGWHH